MTSFTSTQKREIFETQRGRCYDCGDKFDNSRFPQYHHVISKSEGGRNDVSNGQALCPNCHEATSRYQNKNRGKPQPKVNPVVSIFDAEIEAQMGNRPLEFGYKPKKNRK